MIKTLVLTTALALAGTTAAFADGHSACGIESGSVRILGNEFPAIQTVVAAAKECAVDGAVTVTSNLNKDHKDIQVAALKASPAEYTAALVANGSIVPLLNEGLIRPLDDLVAKFGADIPKSQLITIDGKVYAVAFMANAQHLMFRKDVLEKAGVEAPKSYEDVLAAAKAIKDAGIMEYPLAGTYKAGWNLAEEFVNMYLGLGGNELGLGNVGTE
ncbi:MAG: extracellular solute-binding protein, partial [Pseudomonadota bacterium]